MTARAAGQISVVAPDGVDEVRPGDDLLGLLLSVAALVDGDVVVVTSKVVSKAEGRLVSGVSREQAITEESTRVVARRGETSIVRTKLGLTMAAAGIDRSNVATGTMALLPVDPDASARRLRTGIAARTGRNVAVVVTDTAGRAWREGQTDIAIGAAGLVVLEEHAGRHDAHGNELAVTAPAVADEVAGTAELAQGKLSRRPFAVVRGLAALVLPAGEHGPGAAALIRPETTDMFGYGAREAVVKALVGDPAEISPFGGPATPEELAAAIELVIGHRARWDGSHLHLPGPVDCRLAPLVHAHGWTLEEASWQEPPHADVVAGARMRPVGP